MHKVLTLLLSLWTLGGAAKASAQEAFVPPMPQDMDKVDMYLITVGRGPTDYALFGHTILRVVDHTSNLDLNFNWGIFDFHDPRFLWNFYIGNLNYMMIITDFVSLIEDYRNIEHRRMIQDRLVLTAKQKTTLMRRLIWNSQPENIHYQYAQFLNNCATKPRDHLDEALGGKIRDFYANRPADATWRDHIKRTSSALWWVHMGLDTVTNDVLDHPATNWEEMFLPEKLRDLLRDLPAFDDNGNSIPGRNLLEGSEMIVDMPEPHPGLDPYMMWMLLIGVPSIIAMFFAYVSPTEKRAAILIGLVSVVFGLWSSFWGTVMTSNWAVSHYVEVKHNAYLWVFWPIDWLFVVYGIRLLLSRRRPEVFKPLARVVKGVSILHLIGIAALAGLWASGIVRQSVLPILASSGVIGLIYFGALVRQAAAKEP